MKATRHFLTVAVGVLALTACAAPAPDQTAAPTPVPTSTPEPVAETIVVGGSDFAVLDADGAELDRIAYSADPESAVDVLADAIGAAPETAVEGAQTCFGEYDTRRWDESLALKSGENLPLPADALFELEVTGELAGGIRLQTPQGFAVGEPIAELTASVPEAPAVQFETGGAVVNFEVVTGSEEDGAEPYYGAQATDLEATGLIGGIRAPLDFRFDC